MALGRLYGGDTNIPLQPISTETLSPFCTTGVGLNVDLGRLNTENNGGCLEHLYSMVKYAIIMTRQTSWSDDYETVAITGGKSQI